MDHVGLRHLKPATLLDRRRRSDEMINIVGSTRFIKNCERDVRDRESGGTDFGIINDKSYDARRPHERDREGREREPTLGTHHTLWQLRGI